MMTYFGTNLDELVVPYLAGLAC